MANTPQAADHSGCDPVAGLIIDSAADVVAFLERCGLVSCLARETMAKSAVPDICAMCFPLQVMINNDSILSNMPTPSLMTLLPTTVSRPLAIVTAFLPNVAAHCPALRLNHARFPHGFRFRYFFVAQSLNIDLSQFFAFKTFDISSERRKLSVVMQAQQLMAGEPGASYRGTGYREHWPPLRNRLRRVVS